MKQKAGLKCVGGTAVADQPADISSRIQKNVTLPTLLQKVRNKAMQDLHHMMGEMFNHADDLFFEYASKAGDSMSQNMCLDAMREFRLKRKQFEKCFFAELTNHFNLIALPSSKPAPLEPVASVDSLSLMATDEVEETVATDTMVNKAREDFMMPLYQLQMRLDALMVHTVVDKENNPLDPLQLCAAFRVAIRIIESDIKYRLMIFKLFQRHVLDALGSVIDNSNRYLVEAGLLPDLQGSPSAPVRRPVIGAQPSESQEQGIPAGATPAPVSAPGAVGVESAADLFAQVQLLLASVRGMSGVGAGAIAGPIGSVAAGASEVAPSDLMKMLSGIQQAQPNSEAAYFGEQQARLNVPGILGNVLRQQEQKAGPKRVGQADADIISLVSMLFEYILDDENLSDRVKAVIGRLQIPFLKVAINDKSFLSSAVHPARKLLNELAHAGIGLNDPTDQIKNDMVFKKITETVQRVLNEFSEDVSVFDGIVADFTRFMSQEIRRSEMIEQRTKAAEEGRVFAEDAKKQVALALHEKVDGKYLPMVVAQIIDGPWSNYLFLVYAKQGAASKAWQQGLNTVDRLIESVTPVETEAEKKALFNSVPSLLASLRAGFNTISLNPFEMNEMLNGLEQIQMEVMRGDKPEYIVDIEENKEPTDQLLDAVAKDLPPIVPHTEKVAKLEIKRKIQEENKIELPELPSEDEHLSLANRLQVGNWLELEMDDQTVRCKLAAHIKSVDKMIFVNRVGTKVLEKSKLEIAYDIKSGKLTVLDDSLLFDRALESVISNLKSVREKA